GIAPTFHSSASGQGLRNSPSNFVYNHIGHFAAAGHAVSKAIFLGGVTRRFPELRFAFLEGGVGWAAQLFGDLIEHWERRGAPALELKSFCSPDIGHFDVIDFRDPLPQAHELVEKGLITDDDFRDFVFANSVRLWGTQNSRFFEGTRVAKEAAAVLNTPSVKAAAD